MNLKKRHVFFVVLVLASSTLRADAPTTRPISPRVTLVGPTAALQGMERILLAVDFDAMPLEKAIDYFQKQSELNWVVNWKDIRRIGFGPAVPVNLHLKNVPLGEALEWTLQVVGSPSDRIRFQLHGDTVWMGSESLIGSGGTVRIYDVSDLVERQLNWSPPSLTAKVSPLVPRGDGELRGKPERLHNLADDQEKALKTLTQMIAIEVDPDAWTNPRPGDPAVKSILGRLVIRQSFTNHRRIEALLDALAKQPALPETRPATAPATLGKSQ